MRAVLIQSRMEVLLRHKKAIANELEPYTVEFRSSNSLTEAYERFNKVFDELLVEEAKYLIESK